MKASTFLIVFSVSFRFHGNGTALFDEGDVIPDLCNADDDNAVSDIIPDCLLGANNVNFYLWNSQVPWGVIVDLNSDDIPIANSSKRVIMLVHGFTSEANNSDYKNLTDAWLEKSPEVNIFSVDWKEGACSGGLSIFQLLSYPEAVLNIGDVAKEMVDFVEKLMTTRDILLENVGFVGHSLGAHVTGFAGKELQNRGIGKTPWIVALDPAGPGFQFNRCARRLCKSDARIVEVIHTSVLAGSRNPIGDIDLMFNGGATQPGCSIIDVRCSHGKSVEYLSQTIRNERKFVGKEWDSIYSPPPTFEHCTVETCTVPGLLALELPARGLFWVVVPVDSTSQ